MSRWLVTLVALFAPAIGASTQQALEATPAQTPAAVESDPDYVLDAAFIEGTQLVFGPVVRPTVIKAPRPGYTDDAWRRKVQGHVMVSARIGADGTVEAVRVRKSLDRAGLDLEAMKAARQWVFTPATLRGTAVPVLVDIVFAFNMMDDARWSAR